MRQRRRTRARGIQGDGFAMEGTRASAGERAADLLEQSAIRFLLDGLEVGSISELKQCVDVARAARRLQEALHRDFLDLRAEESSRRHGELLVALGWGQYGEPPDGWDDRARVDLMLGIERARAEGLLGAGGAWIYVTFDEGDSHPVNAAGFWPSEADAMLAASTDPDEGVHHPLPLFVLNPR